MKEKESPFENMLTEIYSIMLVQQELLRDPNFELQRFSELESRRELLAEKITVSEGSSNAALTLAHKIVALQSENAKILSEKMKQMSGTVKLQKDSVRALKSYNQNR